MSWNRTNAAAAICDTLSAATAGAVTCFERPPATFNVPAYIVAHPQTVAYNTPAFGVDLATLPIVCAAGIDQTDTVDGMVDTAIKALEADPTLAGTVQTLQVKEQRNWRAITVGGADYVACDLIVEIHMSGPTVPLSPYGWGNYGSGTYGTGGPT